MKIALTAATKSEQIEFELTLRRAIARFCYFHRGGQKQLRVASGLTRTTIWKMCHGVFVRWGTLQKVARILPGWDAPHPGAVTLKDHLSVSGNIAAMLRRTGINDLRLHNAAHGRAGGVSESQKARILAAYPGLITPDSFSAHPDRKASTAPREQIDTIQQMTAPNAPKAPKEAPPVL